MGLDEYSDMLRDRTRISRFREAIERIVRPADVVVEIGAGLGTYSFFACRAGAARVYAIEESSFEALTALARRQGYGDRLPVIRGSSLEARLPERANLIIFEDFNSAFLGAGLAPVVHDATRRLLAPGGRWLPEAAEVWAALAEAPGLWEKLALWNRGPAHVEGIDLAPLSGWLLNSIHKESVPRESVLTPPRPLRRYRLGDLGERFDLDWSTRERPAREGTVHGICAWFRLDLGEGISLDTGPGADETVYGQEFFPLPEPVALDGKEEVEWSLECVPGAGGEEAWWKWGVTAGGRLVEGTTFAGFPLDVEELARRSAEKVPRPDRRHEVQRFILGAVDGRLTQGEIAEKLRAAFPEEFPSAREALRRVVKVLGG